MGEAKAPALEACTSHTLLDAAEYDLLDADGAWERDYLWLMEGFQTFFDGTDGTQLNANAGNHILVRGTSAGWAGIQHGFTIYEDFLSATDTSPSRYHMDNIFADCEIDRIWDEDGHFFLSGYHHDGRVTVELRQLSDAGEGFLSSCLDSENDLDVPRPGDFLASLWEDVSMCPPVRYAERVASMQTKEPPAKKVSLASEARDALKSQDALAGDSQSRTSPDRER